MSKRNSGQATDQHPGSSLAGSELAFPIPARLRGWVFWLAVIALVPFSILMSGRLANATAKHGIVSLELARDARRADEILQSWGPEGQQFAIRNIYLDFGYLVCYSLALSLACLWAAGIYTRWGRGRWLARIGLPIAQLQLLAGALDVIENLAMLQMLPNKAAEPWPHIASTAATLKFLLVIVGGLYSVAAIAPYSPLIDKSNSKSL